MSESSVEIKDLKLGDTVVAAEVDGVRGEDFQSKWRVVESPTRPPNRDYWSVNIRRLDAAGNIADRSDNGIYRYSCGSGRVYRVYKKAGPALDEMLRAAEAFDAKRDLRTKPGLLKGPELIAGLTRAQCLERYEVWQRNDAGPANVLVIGKLVYYRLSPAQIAVAKEEWSAALRAKKLAAGAEKARREYESLAVDDDRWDVE